MLEGEALICVAPGWQQIHLSGPITLRAIEAFVLSRVDILSGQMRGILEVIVTLGATLSFVKCFLKGAQETRALPGHGVAEDVNGYHKTQPPRN